MITAIPMNDQTIAPHFSKAVSVAFFNSQGEEIGRAANPAANTDCSGKKDLIQLLELQKVDRVLVRHIGQKMLGRLLAKAFPVFQLSHGRESIDTVIALNEETLQPLTDESQGSPSVQHEKKMAEGSSCCGDDKDHSCCGENHGSHDAAEGEAHAQSCCQKRRPNPQPSFSARHHSRGGHFGRHGRR